MYNAPFNHQKRFSLTRTSHLRLRDIHRLLDTCRRATLPPILLIPCLLILAPALQVIALSSRPLRLLLTIYEPAQIRVPLSPPDLGVPLPSSPLESFL